MYRVFYMEIYTMGKGNEELDLVIGKCVMRHIALGLTRTNLSLLLAETLEMFC